MKELLNKMVDQLSDQDKLIFAKLAKKLNNLEGDISKLSEEEMALISVMESKYADKLKNIQVNEPAKNFDILDTGFAAHAREILAKDLSGQFPMEEDAVRFAYQNKWIPEQFKIRVSAEKIFDEYQRDISDANQWRDDVVGVDSDKLMAVGMTWFMVLYQLNQKIV